MERQYFADRTAFYTAALPNVKDPEYPPLEEILAEFDARLAGTAEPESPHLRLLKELGVA